MILLRIGGDLIYNFMLSHFLNIFQILTFLLKTRTSIVVPDDHYMKKFIFRLICTFRAIFQSFSAQFNDVISTNFPIIIRFFDFQFTLLLNLNEYENS